MEWISGKKPLPCSYASSTAPQPSQGDYLWLASLADEELENFLIGMICALGRRPCERTPSIRMVYFATKLAVVTLLDVFASLVRRFITKTFGAGLLEISHLGFITLVTNCSPTYV